MTIYVRTIKIKDITMYDKEELDSFIKYQVIDFWTELLAYDDTSKLMRIIKDDNEISIFFALPDPDKAEEMVEYFFENQDKFKEEVVSEDEDNQEEETNE